MNEREIFIRDWTVPARLGIEPHERTGPQRLRLNISLIQRASRLENRSIDGTVNYAAHKTRLAGVIAARHYDLLEELAELLAATTLEDPHVATVTVTLEKLDIFPDCISGIRITRQRA